MLAHIFMGNKLHTQPQKGGAYKGIEMDWIRAFVKNGVLKSILPRSERVKTRKITVTSGQ